MNRLIIFTNMKNRFLLFGLFIVGLSSSLSAQFDPTPVINQVHEQVTLVATVSGVECDFENECFARIDFEANSLGLEFCNGIPIQKQIDDSYTSIGELMNAECFLMDEEPYIMDCNWDPAFRFHITLDVQVGEFPIMNDMTGELERTDEQRCLNITKVSVAE